MKTAEIIYGSKIGHKDNLMFKKMKEILDEGGKVLYIVPEQYAFNADKNVLFNLSEKYSHLTDTINFKRMALSINEKKDYITEEIKNLILYKIYLDNASSFLSLKKRGSSPDLVLLFRDILTELKTNLISDEDLKKVLEQLPKSSLLYRKLYDLILISNEYDKYIKNRFSDFSDGFLTLAKNISENKLYEDYHIFIDNFIHLSKSEYLVINELMKNAKSIHITLLLPDFCDYSEGDLFFLTKTTADTFIKMARDLSYEIKKTSTDSDNSLSDIFDGKILNNKLKNVTLTNAKTRRDEVRSVVSQIKALVCSGASYNDIGVFAGDLSVYEDIIPSLFKMSDIPYFDDKKEPVSKSPICKLLISAFSFYLSGCKTEEMICYLKNLTFLYNIKDGVSFFEALAVNFKIDASTVKNPEKWQIALDTALKGSGYLLTKKALINSVYEKFVFPVCEAFSSLKAKNAPQMYTECFLKFIKAIKLEDALQRFLKNSSQNEIASAYNMIISAIKNIEKINSEDIKKEDWFNLLKQSAGVYKTGKLPNLMDAVIVSDTSRGRSDTKKYIFVLGLNDGVTPKTENSSGFLSDTDRQLIENVTGTTLPTAMWKNNSSLLSFFRTCSLFDSHLYISKCDFSDDGNELTPSFMWQRFLENVEDIREYNSPYSNKREALRLVIGENIEGALKTQVYSENAYIISDIEKMKEENYFDTKKRINKELINSKYQKKLNTSVSRLETYQKCGYSYFLKYLMKINEPENTNYDFAKTGTLVHDIIDIFSHRLKEDNKAWEEVTEDYATEVVKSAAYYEVKEKFPKMSMFNPRTRYLVSKLTKTAKTAVMYIREHFISGSFVPLGYELEIGEKGVKPVTVLLSDGTVLEIFGRIDRADTYFDKASNKLYVRIIDYKSSHKTIDFAMVKEGIQLQLLSYLASIVKNGQEYMDFSGEILPGAALYMAFDHSMTRFSKTPASEEIEKSIREKFMMDGIILNDDTLISAIDKELTENISYKSQTVNISTDSKGQFSTKNLIYREQFKVLLQDCENIIKETGEKIIDGEFFIKPYRFSDKTACDWCIYKGICNFDNTVNTFKTIGKLSQKDYFNN